jgi:D-alanine-D-alanine ligase
VESSCSHEIRSRKAYDESCEVELLAELRMKIGILYDVWEEEGAPPEPPEPKLTTRKKKSRKKAKREKEDREEIFEALEKLSHEPFYQVLDGTPQCLTALTKCEADLMFNLTESYAGDDTKEMHVAAYLDLLGIP